MRLIDADALMREFAEFVRRSNNSDFADIPTWNDAVSLLGSAPTIEPKKGKWIKHVDEECEEANWYECPNCHRFKRIATLYCPFCGSKNEGYEWADNCGAKMERREEWKRE